MKHADPATVPTVPVVLRPGEDGYVIAECPVIPGCISQGKNREEALANIREAISLCIDTHDEETGWDLPKQYEIVKLRLAS